MIKTIEKIMAKTAPLFVIAFVVCTVMMFVKAFGGDGYEWYTIGFIVFMPLAAVSMNAREYMSDGN